MSCFFHFFHFSFFLSFFCLSHFIDVTRSVHELSAHRRLSLKPRRFPNYHRDKDRSFTRGAEGISMRVFFLTASLNSPDLAHIRSSYQVVRDNKRSSGGKKRTELQKTSEENNHQNSCWLLTKISPCYHHSQPAGT